MAIIASMLLLVSRRPRLARDSQGTRFDGEPWAGPFAGPSAVVGAGSSEATPVDDGGDLRPVAGHGEGPLAPPFSLPICVWLS